MQVFSFEPFENIISHIVKFLAQSSPVDQVAPLLGNNQSRGTQIDFFRLQTGQTFQIPFKQLIVFATNLDPEDLVDDAFLRRIQIKVEVTRPDEKLFYRLFATMCQQFSVPFDKDSFVYLLQEWYHKTGRKFQAVHPRDILKGVVALCEYEGIPNQLNPQLIDEACVNYFVRPQSSDS